jgi:hypothetical protein
VICRNKLVLWAMLMIGAGGIGCGSDADKVVPDQGRLDQGSLPDGRPDRQVAPGDGPVIPNHCQCAPNQVCDNQGQCITPQPETGDVVGEVVLLHQVAPLDTTMLKKLGKASARFFGNQALPTDTRTVYPTPDGERCAYEVGTIYPEDWPAPPFLDAGKTLTFTVAGAASPIEITSLDVPTTGTAYFHDDIPPHYTEGSSSYPDFFDPVYLPAGATFEVAASGGKNVGAQTFSGGELPAIFTITAPAVESAVASVPSNQDLTITWSPAQASASMEIFITDDDGMGNIMLLSCNVKDDGALTVPAAALKNFVGTLGLQLRRTVVRYTKAATVDGKVLHLYLTGRHARLGSFKLE